MRAGPDEGWGLGVSRLVRLGLRGWRLGLSRPDPVPFAMGPETGACLTGRYSLRRRSTASLEWQH